MQNFDVVVLKTDCNLLSDRGIFGGCFGTIISFEDEDVLVLFQNKQNVGDYAFCHVNMHNLLFCQKYEEEELADFIEFLNRCDRNKTAFKAEKVKYLDRVKLICDKPSYLRFGVECGMHGTVVTEFAVRDKWGVLFDIFDPNSESDDILVDEADLLIIT